MNKLLAFIVWPTLAGLMFALTLLYTPRLIEHLPGLAAYFPQPVAQGNSAPSFSYSTAIKKAAPAVVSINTQQIIESNKVYLLNPFELGKVTYRELSNSLGSGVIISPDGFIITSYHVLFNPEQEQIAANDITVTLNDGSNAEARLVFVDEENDLVLLKIDAEALPFLKQADTSKLLAGDVVLAIGNPRNIGQSVSFGIISALWQREDSFVIQTDAAINPGNSGGALIDTYGNLVGINSTIVTESGGSEGISFAIPAGKAMRLLDEYLASGPSGYLGVETKTLPLAEGIKLYAQDVQGFIVTHVAPNSPADKAGIHVDDIITGVNDIKLVITDGEDEQQARDAISAVSKLKPGELGMIEIFRDGMFISLPAILGIGEPSVSADADEALETQPQLEIFQLPRTTAPALAPAIDPAPANN